MAINQDNMHLNSHIEQEQQKILIRREVRERSDRIMNYFLVGFFSIGFLFAFRYDTWLFALGIGGICLIAYYSIKILLPDSDVYQYILSAILGIFMAQYIYQMHGLFEMHFFAFIGSVVLVTYQNWKLQIPMLVVVALHHAIFNNMQGAGYEKIYFSQLSYLDLETFTIHLVLTTIIFFICGLWSYQLKKYSEIQISQAMEMGRLQKEAVLHIERKRNEEALEHSNKELRRLKQDAESAYLEAEKERHLAEQAELAVTGALEEKNIILESIGDGFFAVDKLWKVTYWNNQAEKMLLTRKNEIVNHHLWEVFAHGIDSQSYVKYHYAIETNQVVHFEDYYQPLAKWYEVSAFPSESGLSVYLKDVTARKLSEIRLNELNENLKKQAKELAESNDDLEQFAYVASHDLQEPLRMVSSFLTQLEKKYGDVLDDKAKKYIDFAVDGAKRMQQIILDLLEFSRVGKTKEDQEDLDLRELVNEIQILFRKQMGEKSAVIHMGALPVISGYKAPLRQVFQNLIGNALKYTRENVPTEIYITAKELKDHWQFALTDNGIGIDKVYFDRIFIIFQRLHTKDKFSGTGMGLAVTKKIIEKMGGKIWVESIEGKGSTFHWTIANKNGPE